MKTYEERTADILAKAKKEQSRRRKRIFAASTTLSCVCLVLAAAIIAGVSGVFPPRSVLPIGTEGNGASNYVDNLCSFDGYADVYAKLKIKKNSGFSLYKSLFGSKSNDTKGAAERDAAPANEVFTTEASDDFSDTNVQVEGIAEADVVKTDGRYIYAVSRKHIYIIFAENGKMENVSKFPLPDIGDNSSAYGYQLYISDGRLTAVFQSYDGADQKTCAAIYDISDISYPSFVKTFCVSGNIVSSRMKDNVLYLIAADYYYDRIVKNDPATYVPKIYTGEEEALVAPENIYCEKDGGDFNEYLNVCSVDVSEAKIVSKLSLLGYGAGDMYQSANAIYAARTEYDLKEASDGRTVSITQTVIVKITTDKELSLAAEGKVPGSVLNSFSMDEYRGYFRLVTSVPAQMYYYTPSARDRDIAYEINDGSGSAASNSLYVLNENLETVGSIEGLAEDERIYSARFDGDTVYFVTFRETDPLFCADLSDPTAPKVLSALKIPGFSDYLHKYTDGLLFGLGHDTYTNEFGGISADNVKLSMFDISDKNNVIEAATLILPGIYYSEASYNHHAILINAGKNIIAFPGSSGEYLVYAYENGSFVEKATISFGEEYSYDAMRGLYIGNFLYIYNTVGITSYSLDDFAKTDALSMDENDSVYTIID